MRPTREQVERLIRPLHADGQPEDGPDAATGSAGHPQRMAAGIAGLTAAREIVEALGGTLHLDPLPKRGTRVTIVVPLRRQHG